MGTAILSLTLIVIGLSRGIGWLFVAGLLYLIGTFLVTTVFNVPLNNRLAAVTPESACRGRAVGALPQPLERLEPRPHRELAGSLGGVYHRPAALISVRGLE